MTKVIPSGANILPSIPERKKRGTKLATIISVEFKIGIRTSLEASNTTVMTLFCSSLGFCLFSFRRLNTFSTSTIALSTNEPIAMAIPPRLIVLMVSPSTFRVRMATITASGMVISEIMVVRTFIRKRSSTITTKIPPSYRDFCTLSIELLIKRA